VHVDAEGAAIDLRNPQIDEIDQFLRQAAFLKRGVHAAEGLEALGRSLGVVDAVAHGGVLVSLKASIVLHLGLPEEP
jgi:hypothetical protein